jgi:hypothetical protein
MRRLLLPFILTSCAPDPRDKPTGDPDPVLSCAPGDHDALSLSIGTGQASEFTALGSGDTVTLDVAPQGGYGVSIRAKTAGLNTDSPVEVLLETEINGTLSGSFVNLGTNLYCQDDGKGLLWGVVVGFDSDTFADPDALIALDGESALLIVAATDVEGRTARGEVVVRIEVGG